MYQGILEPPMAKSLKVLVPLPRYVAIKEMIAMYPMITPIFRAVDI